MSDNHDPAADLESMHGTGYRCEEVQSSRFFVLGIATFMQEVLLSCIRGTLRSLCTLPDMLCTDVHYAAHSHQVSKAINRTGCTTVHVS